MILHCLQGYSPRVLERSFDEGLLGQRPLKIGNIFFAPSDRKIKQNFLPVPIVVLSLASPCPNSVPIVQHTLTHTSYHTGSVSSLKEHWSRASDTNVSPVPSPMLNDLDPDFHICVGDSMKELGSRQKANRKISEHPLLFILYSGVSHKIF